MAEGFLARWARLKRASAEPPRPTEPPAEREADDGSPLADTREAEAPAPPWMAALTPAETLDAGETPPLPLPLSPGPAADPEPPLPPVEALSAESDYQPFLKPSVPDALRLAALRKAWSTDPEIAAFRGFADYDWDYNAPGYGKLLPTDNIARLRDAIFGDRPPPEPPRRDGPAGDEPPGDTPPSDAPAASPEPSALVAEASDEAPAPAGPGPVETTAVPAARDRREA